MPNLMVQQIEANIAFVELQLFRLQKDIEVIKAEKYAYKIPADVQAKKDEAQRMLTRLNSAKVKCEAAGDVPDPDLLAWAREFRGSFAAFKEGFLEQIRAIEAHEILRSTDPELVEEVLDFNEYPEEIRINKGGAPMMGDAHASALKILHFVIRNGMAKFNLGKGETKEDLYSEFAFLCDYFSSINNLHGKKKAEVEKKYHWLKEIIGKIDFKDQATMLFIGDILMDRNGNDAITALIFKRMQACGARPIILLSNHDAAFFNWFMQGRSEDYNPLGNQQGASAFTMEALITAGIIEESEVTGMLDEAYLNNLAVFYYEVDAHSGIHNITSHAANGEWEIYEMLQGLAEYSQNPKNKALFLPEQIERLKAIQKIKFNDKKGLNDWDLKEMMDVMNEVLHYNAVKPDKLDFLKLMYLGVDTLSKVQQNGDGIPPRVAPFHRAMWNRDSPRAAPPEGKRRVFFNGHDKAKRDEQKMGKIQVWVHNNESLDDDAGKPGFMKAVTRYARGAPGVKPMQLKKLAAPKKVPNPVLPPTKNVVAESSSQAAAKPADPPLVPPVVRTFVPSRVVPTFFTIKPVEDMGILKEKVIRVFRDCSAAEIGTLYGQAFQVMMNFCQSTSRNDATPEKVRQLVGLIDNCMKVADKAKDLHPDLQKRTEALNALVEIKAKYPGPAIVIPRHNKLE